MCDDSDYAVREGPAYNVHAWNTTTSAGPQCSQWGDFCYLCQFQERPEEQDETGKDADADDDADDDVGDDVDFVGDLKAMIHSMVAEGKERSEIVSTTFGCYNRNIRPHIEAIIYKTGKKIKCPEWSRESIDRHLVYSGTFPELHDQTIENMMMAVIDTQNMSLRDMDTGRIIEENRKPFMDTIANWTKFKQYRLKVDGAAGKLGRRKPRAKPAKAV